MIVERRKVQKANWLATLTQVVTERPLVLLRFTEEEWERLRESRRGTREFTIARSHDALRKVRAPTPCVLAGQPFAGDRELHFGVLKSKSASTTLESRLKIEQARAISPSTEAALLRLVTDRSLKANFRARLEDKKSVIRLSPALSVHLVAKLAALSRNRQAMRAVAASLQAPKTYAGNFSLQQDAVGLALKAFGLPQGEAASLLDTVDGKDTALARVSIREDAVIEHDARVIPGFSLRRSSITGRAVFRKGNEVLEIITANKRPLEEVLGVDLIYLNGVKKNVVMVQYKMLEAARESGDTDWLYRPDGQLEKELDRMRLFSQKHAPGRLEYRINPQVFYLRFVRRDAELGKGALIMPIDHFEVLRDDPACKGPKGAFRISYDTLGGRYLRQEGFLDLVSAGYIGAYARGTGDLTALIEATLKKDRAVVAAVQSSLGQ